MTDTNESWEIKLPCGLIPTEFFIENLGLTYTYTYSLCCGNWNFAIRTDYAEEISND